MSNRAIGLLFAVGFSLILWSLVAMLFIGCARQSADEAGSYTLEDVVRWRETPAERVLVPSEQDQIMTAVLVPDQSSDLAFMPSSVRTLMPPTRCDPAGRRWMDDPSLPSVAHQANCWAGEEFVAVWTIAYTDLGSLPRHRPAWLLVSTRRRQEPFSLNTMGAKGCWMLVYPDNALPAVMADEGLIRDTGNRVELRWTPDPMFAGMTWFAQLIWLEPGVQAGYMTGPALEITVGRR